jgi:hypothetical protein
VRGFRRLWYRYPGRWILPVMAWLDRAVPGTRGRVGWLYRPVPRPGDFVVGSTTKGRRRPAAIRPERRERHVPVGTEWAATVSGRGPEAFAKAYEDLRRLSAKVGIDMDDSRVRVESVQTPRGPGLRLVLGYRLDEPEVDGDLHL